MQFIYLEFFFLAARMKSNYALNKNNYSTYIPVIHKNIAVGCTIIWPKVKPKLHFVYNNKLPHQLISNSLSLSCMFMRDLNSKTQNHGPLG